MAPSDFAKANINEIAEKLTADEAIQLIAGVGFWQTHKVDRLGIPTIKVGPFELGTRDGNSKLTGSSQVSDGPNGIRGSRFSMATPAKCLPVRSDVTAPSTFVLRLLVVRHRPRGNLGHRTY